MPSFDIVSEVEMNEVRNAVENSERELTTRWDFKMWRQASNSMRRVNLSK